MDQIDRFCLVCHNFLKGSTVSYSGWTKYTCNNRCCQLPPWTRYMATYNDSGDCCYHRRNR